MILVLYLGFPHNEKSKFKASGRRREHRGISYWENSKNSLSLKHFIGLLIPSPFDKCTKLRSKADREREREKQLENTCFVVVPT